MPEKHHNILKFNQEQKSLRILLVIYADTKSLPQKIPTCHTNLGVSYLVSNLESNYAACSYSLYTVHLTATKTKMKIF